MRFKHPTSVLSVLNNETDRAVVIQATSTAQRSTISDLGSDASEPVATLVALRQVFPGASVIEAAYLGRAPPQPFRFGGGRKGREPWQLHTAKQSAKCGMTSSCQNHLSLGDP